MSSLAPIITLTTDFGTEDGSVGAMKGVVARLAPSAVVIDVSHDVPRHDVAAAAWAIAVASREFPSGTIHVVVVDPTVGGARAEVVVRTQGQLFVGPDNGAFAYVTEPDHAAWAITQPSFRMPHAAPTFHGRDVFAPAAAALASGLPPGAAGPSTCLHGRLPWSGRATARQGTIVHIDHFGNLVSNLPGVGGQRIRVGAHEVPLLRTYADVPPGQALAYVGSAGTIEVAIREGDARAQLGIERGAPVEVL